MRNSVVLSDRYFDFLIAEGSKYGLVNASSSDSSALDSSSKIAEHYKSKKQDFYQTVLLYDELIIQKAWLSLDYSLLKDISVTTTSIDEFNTFYLTLGTKNPESPKNLKNAMLPFIESIFKETPEVKEKIDVEVFSSALYDISTGIRDLDENDEELFLKFMAIEHSDLVKNKELKDEIDSSLKVFLEGISQRYIDLSWQLYISAKHNAVLQNTDYDLTKLKMVEDSGRTNAAYGILRCEYDRLIEGLPGFTDLREVLRMKKLKKAEIKALREELGNLEDILSSEDPSSQEKAIAQAVKDIQKADNALLKGIPSIQKIGKWTTLAGVPIGAMEFFANPLAGIPVGLTVSAVGAAAALGDEYLQSKYGWMEVIR